MVALTTATTSAVASIATTLASLATGLSSASHTATTSAAASTATAATSLSQSSTNGERRSHLPREITLTTAGNATYGLLSNQTCYPSFLPGVSGVSEQCLCRVQALTRCSR